jgi:hypothetical protein
MGASTTKVCSMRNGGITDSTNKILEDTDKYLKVLATTEVIVIDYTKLRTNKILEDSDKYLKVLATTEVIVPAI